MKIPAILKRQRLRIGLGWGIVLLLVLNTVGVLRLDAVQGLENYAYDLRLRSTMPGGVDPRIVIVDIDEASLQRQGHWPWPRDQLAQLIDRLFEHYQIDALGFDVLFAEADRSSGLAQLEQLALGALQDNPAFGQALQRLRPELDHDQRFADSLKNRRIALGYYFRHDAQPDSRVGALPAPALPLGSWETQPMGAVPATGYSANLPVLQQAAASAGFFNASPLIDQDGVIRRLPLLQQLDGQLYESLSLALLRLALQQPPLELNSEATGPGTQVVESLQLGRRRIPVDADMAALVPYRGRQGSFAYVSASDVLQAKADPALLKGTLVLVGTTAPGLLDLRSTPVQESYAGVELHANMLAGMLDGQLKQRPPYLIGLELVGLLLLGSLLALALPALGPLGASVLTASSLLAVTAGNLYAWQALQLVMPLASSLLLIASLFVFNMSYGFFVDARGKRLLAQRFGQYVPPELVSEMASDPEAYTLEGTSRELTVLFSDVRGFTSISEGLDPHQLTELMNGFLTPMTHLIHRHRGTIDKYMGDCIMAFWGAPVNDAQHARHAVQAALDMVAELERLQDSFQARGWPPIHIGVGLSTGQMTVGNMGSEFRLAYTVMGDAVNLGSRLEGLTKAYGVPIIVSERTRDQASDFVYCELDRVRVKGKRQPVRIFAPLGRPEQVSQAQREELHACAQALQLYQTQAWDPAASAFAALHERHPERLLYRLYLGRIAHFKQQPPPPDWDGSFTFATK